MDGNLGMTNVWLAIIAIVTLLEFLMIMAAGVMAYRLYAKVTTTIEQIEQRHIAPLTAKVHVLVGEMREVTQRVKHAEESVRGAVTSVEDKAKAVAAIAQKGWPVLAGLRAVTAALRAFSHAGGPTHHDPGLATPPNRPWRTV
jgi:uncharacterized protein YoxC